MDQALHHASGSLYGKTPRSRVKDSSGEHCGSEPGGKRAPKPAGQGIAARRHIRWRIGNGYGNKPVFLCGTHTYKITEGECRMLRITLKIDGMSCGMCEAHINDAIRQNFRVKKVTSSHKKGETVILTEQAPEEEKLRAVIDGTGYVLKEIRCETASEGGTGLFGWLHHKK